MIFCFRPLASHNSTEKVFLSPFTDLSVKRLQRVLNLKKKIGTLQGRLNALIGSAPAAPRKRGGRKMSAAGRARIAAAQRARWAKQKGKAAKGPGKARRKMSAAGRARIAAAARARWKAAKAAGKNRL